MVDNDDPGEHPGRIYPDEYLDRTVVTALERFQLGGQEGEPEEPLLPRARVVTVGLDVRRIAALR